LLFNEPIHGDVNVWRPLLKSSAGGRRTFQGRERLVIEDLHLASEHYVKVQMYKSVRSAFGAVGPLRRQDDDIIARINPQNPDEL